LAQAAAQESVVPWGSGAAEQEQNMAIDRKRSYYLLYIERELDILVNTVQKELRGELEMLS
jgi:hypothetical protein